MTAIPASASASFGALLRQWRRHRGVSQLALSADADVSTRHLSFLETGRSRPSRTMVLRVAEHLDIPLRERNRLLASAGFAPQFPRHELTAPEMSSVRAAVREVLTAYEPYPALVVDRTWNILEANSAVGVLTRGASVEALSESPLNALRLTLHPRGLAPHITNLAQWRSFVLRSLRRSALARADTAMLDLYDELSSYTYDHAEVNTPASAETGIHVPFRLRVDDEDLSFLAMVGTFGTALDVTLSELAIETFLPADAPTATFLSARSGPAPAPRTPSGPEYGEL